MTTRKIAYWVMPPEAAAECVAPMAEGLEPYEKPYNPHVPVRCMDEPPVQLLKETRSPIAATATPGKRVAYEDERAGTAAIFRCAEPWAGWREVAVRARKTQSDWAIEMARGLEGRSAACGKVILVGDNLHTHTKGAFYEAFAPERARALVRRLECCYTPKHGSGLNSAENALSALTRQGGADRRVGDVASRREETKAWSNDVNATQRGVDWQMKIDDARTKLKSVYPTIKL
jgi:DDE superfamily endonuclease